MKTKYSAGWNLPGCLPEMEPAYFETEAEADAFILEADVAYSTDEGYNDDDPYVYWVEVVVLDDCPFCETGAATTPVWQAAPLDDTIACEDCASVSLPQ